MDQTKPKADNLMGMDAAGAKEYIYHYSITLKLTKKKLEETEGELAKWKDRVELSRSRGDEALSLEAEKEVRKFEAERAALAGEIEDLTQGIAGLRRQLPGLAARERSIDPDLLEQELVLALGNTPGETGEGARKTAEAWENIRADAALETLKAKMRQEGSR
ncbi:MAG: chromosome partitioning protein [Spirochaetaceae bacterium]|jgi:phage shock protein A|nr:chromosome partitioning protein [Spirochaetaceae bacterium]